MSGFESCLYILAQCRTSTCLARDYSMYISGSMPFTEVLQVPRHLSFNHTCDERPQSLCRGLSNLLVAGPLAVKADEALGIITLLASSTANNTVDSSKATVSASLELPLSHTRVVDVAATLLRVSPGAADGDAGLVLELVADVFSVVHGSDAGLVVPLADEGRVLLAGGGVHVGGDLAAALEVVYLDFGSLDGDGGGEGA